MLQTRLCYDKVRSNVGQYIENMVRYLHMSAKSSTFVVGIAYVKEIPTYREPALRLILLSGKSQISAEGTLAQSDRVLATMRAKKTLIIKHKKRIDI